MNIDLNGYISVASWYIRSIWVGFRFYFSTFDITKLASFSGIPSAAAGITSIVWGVMNSLVKHAAKSGPIPAAIMASISFSLAAHTFIMTIVDKGKGVYVYWNWLTGYCGTFAR